MQHRLLAAALLFSVAVPVALAETFAPYEYRECMKGAIDRHESGLLDSLRQYNDGYEQALDDRKWRYTAAYDAETDREIRDRTREADKEFGRTIADLKEDKRDRDRVINRAYNDERRACKDLRRDIERGERAGQRPTFGECGDKICLR